MLPPGIDFHVPIWMGSFSALKFLCLGSGKKFLTKKQEHVLLRDRIVINISLKFGIFYKFTKGTDFTASIGVSGSPPPWFLFFFFLIKTT